MDILEKYGLELSEDTIDKYLLSVEKNLGNYITEDRLLQCFGAIDLTSLECTDTANGMNALADKVCRLAESYPEIPFPAGVCTYPVFSRSLRKTLPQQVKVVAVAGAFPHSQSFIEVKAVECRMAAENGADEIDTVFPLGKFLSGDITGAADEISTMKEAVEDRKLKVILETGSLQSVEDIAKTSLIAMESGADFIKTSTGKTKQSATPSAAIAMCMAIRHFEKKTGRRIGFKAAGGISTPEEAIAYHAIADTILGKDHLSPELFRIGASRLANNLLSRIKGERVSHF